MSYDILESSKQDGRPVILYRFVLGLTAWHYTSADMDVVFNNITWKSVAISDGGFSQGGESVSDSVNITMPADAGPAMVFFNRPPSQTMRLTIFRGHIENALLAIAYTGEVSQANFSTPGQATMVIETLSAGMQKIGLRFSWQRACPYALYDPTTCRVNKAAYAVPMVILAAGGDNVTTDNAGSKPDGWFVGGFIEWQHPVRGREFCAIENHAGNGLLLFGASDGIYPGLAVTAYPGCGRNVPDCQDKFNNFLNYGGIPHMPGKSPFDGDPIF